MKLGPEPEFLVQSAANIASSGIRRGSVQTVVTSPPYWKGRDYGHGNSQLGFEDRIAMYVSHLCDLLDGLGRVMCKSATMWVVIGDSYNTRAKIRPTAHNPGLGHSDSLTGDTNVLSWKEMSAAGRVKHSARTGSGYKEKDLVPVAFEVASELRQRGWHYRADIIWEKPYGKPERVLDRPSLTHEHIMLFTLAEREYYFQRTPETKRSVWTINPGSGIPGLSGPAVFPSELVRRCLEATTRDGDLVLDPFAGSGVTLHTARQMNRRAVGMDLTNKWWEPGLSELHAAE